ncbi:hypothetical protein MRX96_014479 [Rhipicephalus microplus]
MPRAVTAGARRRALTAHPKHRARPSALPNQAARHGAPSGGERQSSVGRRRGHVGSKQRQKPDCKELPEMDPRAAREERAVYLEHGAKATGRPFSFPPSLPPGHEGTSACTRVALRR